MSFEYFNDGKILYMYDGCVDYELKNINKDIEKIYFGDHNRFESVFNKKADNLPQNINEIIFSYYFNQKVDKLPHNLT